MLSFSARYVINFDVPNPLTCRHKHLCACHGQQPRQSEPRPSEKEYKQRKQELEQEFIDIADRLALALRPFPEARVAFDNVLTAYRERHPT